MPVKRKSKVAKKTAQPAIVKTLRKQMTQLKLKCAKMQKQSKLIKEQSYKKGFNDALKSMKKLEAAKDRAFNKLLKAFKAKCLKAVAAKKKPAKRKTAAKKSAIKKTTRKLTAKKRTAIKKKATTRRKPAKKSAAARRKPLKKKAATRKIAKKASPRRKTVVRKARSIPRVLPARRAVARRGNSAHRSH